VTEWILSHEGPLRLGCFLGVFALVAVGEIRFPRRPIKVEKRLRWINNILLVAVNTLLTRLLFPAAAVGAAALAEIQGWGLFQAIPVPTGIAVVLSVILLDLAIYLQHIMFHAVPLFWRLSPGPPYRSRLRRHDGNTFPPDRNHSIDDHQVLCDLPARRTGHRGHRLRDTAQCHCHVQPRQSAPTKRARYRPTTRRRDARYAPSPSFDGARRDQ